MVDAVNTTPPATTTPPPAASSSPSVSAPTPAPAPSPAPEAPVAPAAAPAATNSEASVVSTPEKPETTPAQAPTPEAPPATPLGGADDDESTDEPAEEPEGAEGGAETPPEGEAPKEEGEKESTEGDKPEGEKKDEASQSEEPAPLPAFEAFTVPEGMNADPESLGNLTKLLGEFEVKTGASHEEVQAFGQSLVDRHVEQLNKTVAQVSEVWRQNWENQKKGWFEAFKSDPEIGGNRMDTTTKAARQFIRTHGGDADQQKEFRELMDTSGVGNHPSMIRMLAKAMKAMSEGKPLPAGTPVSEKKGRAATLYGGR